jgi:hypothetical protein
MEKKQTRDEGRTSSEIDAHRNRDQQGVDKAPEQEAGKDERVESKNLKGKKVDADPSQEADRPV